MKNYPLTIRRLAWQNSLRKPFRTTCLIIIIAIFAATLLGGSILTRNLSDGIQGMSNRLGADILIVPHGYEKNIEVALLRGEPSSFYLKRELEGRLRALPGVSAVSPQLFIASLDAGCCTAKVQLIGFEPDSDFVIEPWLQQQLNRPLQDNEVVVGAKIITEVGGEVQFFGQTFTIAAKMDSTGMGFDTSVFMTMKMAHQLMKRAGIVVGEGEQLEDYVSSLFLRVDPAYQPKDVINSLMPKYAIEYNLDFIMTKGMMSSIAKWLNQFSVVVYSLAGLFWLLSILVIFITFSSSVHERKRELSLLRILGACRQTLVRLLLTESFFISLLGAILGIAFASLLLFSFSALICQSIGLPCVNISLSLTLLYALAVFLLTVITGPLATIYSALAITRTDTYQALREGE